MYVVASLLYCKSLVVLYLALFKPSAQWFRVSLGRGVDLEFHLAFYSCFSCQGWGSSACLLIAFHCVLPVGIRTGHLNRLCLVKLHSHVTKCSNNCPDLLFEVALDEARWRSQKLLLCPCWCQAFPTFRHRACSSSQALSTPLLVAPMPSLSCTRIPDAVSFFTQVLLILI